jgi:hypothetical protein
MERFLTQALIKFLNKMNQFEIAIEMEADKNYTAAVQIYEEIISNKNAPKDSFINLAFLYWEFAAEFAFAEAYNIPDTLRTVGGRRYSLILAKGLLNYPFSTEIHFWAKYFPYRLYFEKFPQEECLEILKKYGENESLVPYFYLYLFDKRKYEDKRKSLLLEWEMFPTAKYDYIKSILE